ncbi:MAG: c-type cytochrome biogenesis protein CcmI [Methyloceanibacter sp.]|uniref:c-type cytochrome biogenesis protein CcmI n=1 Tax=Methyloceanibacter sp. TaxID=1965321 RepID=UPI003D6D69B6
MLLWVILAGLTAIVLFVLLRPLVSGGAGEPGRGAFDAAVYRDQLEEIESDRARGLLGEAEAEAARLEVSRRLLAADANTQVANGARRSGTLPRAALIGVALALPLAALGLYLTYGSPRLPDQPLAARLQDPANDQNLAALVARVEARLREHPEEGEGWDVIAPVYMGWRRYGDAADAYAQAIRLLGPSAKRLSGHGQALVLETGGVVTEEARKSLEGALALDASLVEPRILLAIAKEQDGEFAAAIDDWRGLLEREGADERWRAMVQKRIEAAEAQMSGKPIDEAQDVRGPSAADIAAAQNMSPADRAAMAEQMVQRLAARLEQQGDDLGGWLQLVRAYTVLDRKDDALKALARAKSQFAGKAQAIEQLDALAAELGLQS